MKNESSLSGSERFGFPDERVEDSREDLGEDDGGDDDGHDDDDNDYDDGEIIGETDGTNFSRKPPKSAAKEQASVTISQRVPMTNATKSESAHESSIIMDESEQPEGAFNDINANIQKLMTQIKGEGAEEEERRRKKAEEEDEYPDDPPLVVKRRTLRLAREKWQRRASGVRPPFQFHLDRVCREGCVL